MQFDSFVEKAELPLEIFREEWHNVCVRYAAYDFWKGMDAHVTELRRYPCGRRRKTNAFLHGQGLAGSFV